MKQLSKHMKFIFLSFKVHSKSTLKIPHFKVIKMHYHFVISYDLHLHCTNMILHAHRVCIHVDAFYTQKKYKLIAINNLLHFPSLSEGQERERMTRQ